MLLSDPPRFPLRLTRYPGAWIVNVDIFEESHPSLEVSSLNRDHT